MATTGTKFTNLHEDCIKAEVSVIDTERIANLRAYIDVVRYKKEADFNAYLEAQSRYRETEAKLEEALLELKELESISSV